ncbi:glycosyltransferase, partial [Candidatus Falkowbacteria bacterium]|nr:glycosyltransferase [Candidatus Falkowbacteria bacterium]
MKIANLVCTYPPYKGGIGTAAFNFRELMSDRGLDITTFVPDYGLDIDRSEDEKNKVIRIKPLLRLGNGAFIPALFKKLKDFDIIYIHYPFFGGAEIVWLYKMMHPRKKLIIRYHMDVVGLSWPAKFLSLPSCLIFRSLFAKADKIISASLDYIENGNMKNVYKKYKDKFRQIPYAVDIERFKPKQKDDKIFKMLFVGGLDRAHYFKGVDNLISACALLKDEGVDNWELDIVGSGELLDEYKAKSKELKIDDRVNFLGKVSDRDLPKVYAQNHITVLPSVNKGEAFGIVLIESMASGTPVIASDLAGVRSVYT